MTKHDLIVIGGGPGGYIAAIRAAQLGLDTACVERESRLGGTCLRVGCIPSKAMLESSEKFAEVQHKLSEHGVKVSGVALDLPTLLSRKEQVVDVLCKGVESLFRKHKITRYSGWGQLAGPGQVSITADGGAVQQLSAQHIILAPGSKPALLPGIELHSDRVGTSTEALSYAEVPKHLVVVGGGYIGLELSSVWNRLGAKVTVLEFLNRILPGTDSELAGDALKLFQKQGLEFRLGSRVTSARFDTARNICVVECAGAESMECDRVLVAVGRTPATQNLGLETVDVALDSKGRIPVSEGFRTTAAGLYAIGDCIAGPMLAHKAEEDGVACVEGIVTGYSHVDYNLVPSVIYTHPEIAAVGKTEDQLAAEGTPFRKGTFPFRANARARTLADMDGKVKILAHSQTDRVLGVHIMGPRAGDLIAEAAAAMTFGASSEDIARTCHAHPTLSEAVKEAALAVDGRTLNL
ncbi:MAG TPA: dihydrolipoyl dehydrogenase [Pirellulales bacterium]|jgi:dihydrolipoamide dehydrogenase|nr:dihydrolipoyl dehydrogenase [Pirellulales bacterium]